MKSYLLITSALLLTPASLCFGQASFEERDTPDGQLTIVRLQVDASPEPTPAYKYRLLPPIEETEPGNAVPFYHRALQDKQQWLPVLQKQFGEDVEIESWAYEPRKELPLEKMKQVDSAVESMIDRYLKPASRRSFADWGFNEELLRGDDTISFLLPEIQEARSIGRLLAARARLAILEHRHDDAIEVFQTGFQFARDLSTSKFMVSDLVAIAKIGIYTRVMEEFIASQEAPNLYWALMALPDPLIFDRDSLELELTLGMRMFPWLADVEKAEYAPDEWRRLYTDTLAKLQGDFRGDSVFAVTRPGGSQTVSDRVKQVLKHGYATMFALKAYPVAKEALIASGMPRNEVERMPVAQVLATQTARANRYLTNEVEKAWHVPYHESSRFETEANALLSGDPFETSNLQAFEPMPLARLLLPAVTSFRKADVRLRRQLAALTVIEALRLDAHNTGELPASLDDVRVVPVPINPATGKPFDYKLKGDTAVLLLPTDGFHQGTRYEIRLRN